MNYKRIYNNIIDNRRSNPLNESEYSERHHIIPKSLDGTDEPDNLVRLSAREHFICHALLAEMYEEGSNEWYKMNHAFMMMKSSSDNQTRYINSRLYELKRKDFSKVMSQLNSGKNHFYYGKCRSEQTKKKISDSLKQDRLNKDELRKLQSQIEKKTYTTKCGKYINKNRRDKIKEVFNIDLNNDVDVGFNKLKNLLNRLYIKEGYSQAETARYFKTNRSNICNYLKFCNIYVRNHKESIKEYYNK